MNPVFSPLPPQAPARMLAAVLCALLVAAPVEGKRYDDQTKASDTPSSSSSKTKNTGSTKSSKSTSSASHSSTKKPGSTTHSSTAAQKSATKPRGKKTHVSPAEQRRRAARAHKIKLAFVASS